MGKPLQSINQPSNVQDLHWKLESSQIYYSGNIQPKSGTQLSNYISNGIPNQLSVQDQSSSPPSSCVF